MESNKGFFRGSHVCLTFGNSRVSASGLPSHGWHNVLNKLCLVVGIISEYILGKL